MSAASAIAEPFLAFSMPGGPEWIFILIIVLLLFGAKKLPELARGIGASIGEFKKAKEAFEHEIKQASEDVKLNAPKGLEPHRQHSAVTPSSGSVTTDKSRENPV